MHKDYQRQGLGSEILAHLLTVWHQELGLTSLRASVKTQNQAGLAFLKHFGFQTISEGSARFTEGIQSFLILEYSR